MRELTLLVLLATVFSSVAESMPEEVFRHPPPRAHAGVWWHWMGRAVTREGIVRDLDYFQRMGITTATIFALSDFLNPWSMNMEGLPFEGPEVWSPEWWSFVRFAADEAERRGIEIGLHNCPGYTSTGGPWIDAAHAMLEAPGKVKASFNHPAPKGATGYECDKMSAEAVNFHLDHVLGTMKRELGDRLGKSVRFVHLDSYEAGDPGWTPKMREEFLKRRGYDPLPFLTNRTEKFAADFERTKQELYRDNLMRIMRDRLHAEGLEFSCEPYRGPFDSDECAGFVDRVMTEFWYREDRRDEKLRYLPDPRRFAVIEAEAFSGEPQYCLFSETPERFKRIGDVRFAQGINRFVLHTNPLQPFGDDVRPGMTMGPWGSHFGRTQTWAEDAKAWFDYLARSQALLQWGRHSSERHPVAPGLRQVARVSSDGRVKVFYFLNATASRVRTTFAEGRWFDAVSGEISAPPEGLEPEECGFLVLDGQTAPTAAVAAEAVTLDPVWRVTFPEEQLTVEWKGCPDWATSSDERIRYYSGTAVYRTSFDGRGRPPGAPQHLALGGVRNGTARVFLNGQELGVVWCAPWRVTLPAGLVRERDNELEIRVTNCWQNRMIGDDNLPEDCEWVYPKGGYPHGRHFARWPKWFTNGEKRPTSRRTFSPWDMYLPWSPLLPSGLVGPVRLF